MARPVLLVTSVVVHAALLVGLGSIRTERGREATAIAVFEATPEKAETPPPEPPPVLPDQSPEPAATARPARAVAPAAAAAPASDAAPGLTDLPDLGLELGGVAGGSGGMAVRAGTCPSATPAPTTKTLGAPAAAPPALGGCGEPVGKPKLLNLPRPAYTEAARAAGVSGKVRVSITVDATGRVVDARVLAGLGHGLDEAALAAARGAQFEPAVQCGKPVTSTFTVSIRFAGS